MGGKFRVKVGLQAPSVLRRNGRRINQPPHFHDSKRRSSPFKTLFAWQIGCDYRQWALMKPAIVWQNPCSGPRGFKGTAPDDD
jgi:hypothetical protein